MCYGFSASPPLNDCRELATDERAFLRHRLATLAGLLAQPNGSLRSGGALVQGIRAAWRTEHRLLERILAESRSRAPQETIELWRQRTERFLAAAAEPDPEWRDREGQTWNARQVLAILDDLAERLRTWAESAAGPDEQE